MIGLIPAVRERAPTLGSLRVLTLVYIAGFAVVGFLLFASYPKYPHYVAMLVAPLPAVSAALLLRGNALKVAIATAAAVWVAGVGFFALTTWGHADEDRSLRNVRYLWPTSGTPEERLARRTNRPLADIERELAEYDRALDSLRPGERILLADHEPGALVPSLVDREYLGDAPWLDGPDGRPLRQAGDEAELRREFARARIRFAYRPGRAAPARRRRTRLRAVALLRRPRALRRSDRPAALAAQPLRHRGEQLAVRRDVARRGRSGTRSAPARRARRAPPPRRRPRRAAGRPAPRPRASPARSA